ncbi:MAG: sensor histidine kinase [Rectinemataceae bacterium]
MNDADSPADPLRARLEKEVHLVTWILQVSTELTTILAREESERGYLFVADWIRKAFAADMAAIFSIDSAGSRIRYTADVLGGSEASSASTMGAVEVSEAEWDEAKRLVFSSASSRNVASVDLLGLGGPAAFWLAARLDSLGSGEGCILLGRRDEAWTTDNEFALLSLSGSLASIIVARKDLERETRERERTKALLAASERRYRTIFEDARDMIYSANAEDLVTSINAAGVALTGHRLRSEILGRKFSELVHNPSDREGFLHRLREDSFVDDYEIIMKAGKGASVFCLENATTLKDEAGAIVEVHGIVRDISERVESERQLWKANLELAEANLKLQATQLVMVQHEKLASIGQLAAGIAHEINNPLGFLKSNHAMLEKYFRSARDLWTEAASIPDASLALSERLTRLDRLFSKADGVFTESAEGFARIMAIVANLKSFSRVDRSGEFEDYDLNAGIESTLTVAWNEIKYVAEVVKDFGELPPLRAKGGEINQVILNILVNAAQAIEGQKRKEKGTLRIRTRSRSGRAILEISDDGPGIPEAIRNRIFDPFFTTKEPGKGTGLGLSISYDIIVAKHSGTIRVEEAQGGGTIFTIELPIGGPSG